MSPGATRLKRSSISVSVRAVLGGEVSVSSRSPGTKERTYVALNCGGCYRSPALAPEARFFSCTQCGDPAFVCERCVELEKEYGTTHPVTTCAMCSLRQEMGADAS